MNLFFSLVLVASFSFSAIASNKICSVDMKGIAEVMNDGSDPDAPFVVGLRIVYGENASTLTYLSNNGQSVKTPATVKTQTFFIREDLENVTDISLLNEGENVIAHALFATNDPVLGNVFEAGVDLRKIRSLKLNTIGEVSDMGRLAVIEALDENGKDMGSFIGGFLVRPCQR